MKIFGTILTSGRWLLRSLLLLIFIICCLTPGIFAANEVEVRDDGLTVVMAESPAKDPKIPQTNDYLMMLVKTGSAHDPEGKKGVSVLTGEILYDIFRRYSGAMVQYQTFPEYTLFLFKISHSHYQDFCKAFDILLRLDALLANDYCNELIMFHKNQPQPPADTAYIGLTELLYGADHPYFKRIRPDYQSLNINDVNVWFRKVYQPSNMVVVSTEKIPEDFLRRPSGRNLKDTVKLDKVPNISGPKVIDVKFQTVHDNVSTVEIGFSAPLIGEKGFFATELIKLFLQKDLWDQLRETAGFCYDVRVGYTYFQEPSASRILISFQTLPEDTEQAIALVLERLKLLAKNGIPKDQLAPLLDKEKRNLIFQADSPANMIVKAGLYALYNQNWIDDEESYFDQLSRSAGIVSQTLIEELAGLKISVAGPEGTVLDVGKLKKELEFGK